MKDLGKGVIKFKLGGGLNTLCLACAGAIVIHSLTKLGDWISNNDLRKMVRETNEVLGDIKKHMGASESDFEEV